jgi:O-glycosyl hydrolase
MEPDACNDRVLTVKAVARLASERWIFIISDYKTISATRIIISSPISQVWKPGAVRIGASGYADSNIMYSAFENPDGTYAFVLMNNNEKTKKITLSDGKVICL